ncbi:NADH-quinone oxidoreductase subunit NuoE family protein [Candidatus Methanocrinis natronophilus]|uniref:NADH-quinone oxidoreductase subunit NuoE family protein n=1 Tax=Candidatus Methanocrinis natronophilus TaxID=3033396 RepID=UPI0029348664|nr:NAD(P)H-dependent oxidoreductase subunit E [Candidatus Methanocrinis natronophilus]
MDEIIGRYQGQEGFLIQLLLDLQGELHWIPREVISHLSERLGVPKSQIYRIASFYKAVNLTPVGRHMIQVCMGTACQVRGAQKVLDYAASKLDIGPEETTPDLAFSLRKVNCLGCCSMGPVMTVDGEYHGGVTLEGTEKVLKDLR